jgi:cellulose synthase/poly-beta-1,6-N-acetylglucosamine synthase-like glycosyltransferase
MSGDPNLQCGGRRVSSAPTLSILIPVRNEGVNLKIMLKILSAIVEVPHEVLVAHDTTEDDSIEVVQKIQQDYPEVRLIHNRLGPGVINAIRAGVEAARGEYVLIFAADEVGPVLAIEDMLGLMRDGCEFVSCTRYAHGGRRLGGSLIGGMLSRTANRLFGLLAGSVFTDCTTGIKMFRRDVFEKMNIEARPIGWAVAFEMAIKAQWIGLKLGEVPIISIDRLYGGKSTFKLGSWVGEYSRWFLWGLRRTRQAARKHGREIMIKVPSTSVELR